MAKGTIYLMLGRIVFLISGYTIHVCLARLLGPKTYGTYGVVISFLIWIELAVITGIPTAVRRSVAANSHLLTAIRKKCTKMQLLYSGGVFVFLLLLSPLIANLFGDKRVELYLRVAAIDIPVYALFSLHVGLINGMRDFGRQAMSMVVYSLTKVTMIVILVFIGFSVLGALAGNIFASCSGLVATLFLCRSYKSGPHHCDKDACKSAEIIKFAVPIIILTLARHLLINLDLFCVKTMIKDGAQTGFYASAGALAKTPYFIFLGLISALLPSLSKSIAEGNKDLTAYYIRQAMRFLCILAIPLALLVIATSENLISLVFSSTYLPAASILPVLFAGLTFFTFFVTLSTVLIADNKPYLVFYITVPLNILHFLLNLKLIPIYGICGAAWATTLTTFVAMLIVGGLVFYRFRTLVDLASLFRVGLGSCLIYAIARLYQAPQGFLLIEYFLLLGLYVAILFLTKELKRNDLEAFLYTLKLTFRVI
jgi:O-antigen/teichoic acid export membrane protein